MRSKKLGDAALIVVAMLYNFLIPALGLLVFIKSEKLRKYAFAGVAFSVATMAMWSEDNVVLNMVYIDMSYDILVVILVSISIVSSIFVYINRDKIYISPIFLVTSTILLFVYHIFSPHLSVEFRKIAASNFSPIFNRGDIVVYQKPEDEMSEMKDRFVVALDLSRNEYSVGYVLAVGGDFVGERDGPPVVCLGGVAIQECLSVENVCEYIEGNGSYVAGVFGAGKELDRNEVVLATDFEIPNTKILNIMTRRVDDYYEVIRIIAGAGAFGMWSPRGQESPCARDNVS